MFFMDCDTINELPSYIHELVNIMGYSDFHFMDTYHYFGGVSQKGAVDFTLNVEKDFGPTLNGATIIDNVHLG
jgi:hypothetical protein